jgi:hypothetical protein
VIIQPIRQKISINAGKLNKNISITCLSLRKEHLSKTAPPHAERIGSLYFTIIFGNLLAYSAPPGSSSSVSILARPADLPPAHTAAITHAAKYASTTPSVSISKKK